MIPTATKDLDDDTEVRAGWASWDKGKFKDRSIKYCYRTNGKIPRTAPETPIHALVDMVIFGIEEGEFSPAELKRLRAAINKP